MSALRAALIAAYCLSTFCQQASAQPRGGASERDRGGILGRVGARRDDRFGRNAPAPAPGNPNPALNPNVGPNARGAANPAALNGPNNPAANPLSFGRAAAGAPGARGPVPNPQAQAYPNNSPYNKSPYNGSPYNNRAAGAPTPAPVPQAGSQAAGQRSAYYPQSPGAMRSGTNPYSAATDPNMVPQARDVRPASGTAPVNKLPYNGPGVLVRLPRTIPGEVNYLVDDSEHLVVHSGEDQLLRLKDSYEVRFSRGVTNEGRSYGEARYTITEGVYRFDVSANGWELYREGEARDVEKAIAEAQKRADELQRQAELADTDRPREESSTSLPPLMAPRDAKPAASNEKNQESKSPTPPPTPVPTRC